MITSNKKYLSRAELHDILNNLHKANLPIEVYVRLTTEAATKLHQQRMLRVAN